MLRGVVRAAIASLLSAAVVTPVSGEDLKGRWYFGGNLSFHTTTDYIRSNSAIFTGSFGDDGLPGTGDPNEALTCTDTGAFCDPRPDFLLARQSSIEDGLRVDLTTGFGMTSWLSLQLDASWFTGDAGTLDVYLSEVYVAGSSQGVGVAARELSLPTHVGRITEIPVSITGIVRFNKDAAFNPFIGVGGGIIFTKLDRDPDLQAISDRLVSQRIRQKTDEFGTNGRVFSQPGDDVVGGRVRLAPHLPTADVDDSFEWHLTGGTEYNFSDRVSLVLDARYTFSSQSLRITLGGEDQLDLTTFPELIFRPGGSLIYFNDLGRAPNPLCTDSPHPLTAQEFGCFSNNGPPDPISGEPTPVPIPGARVRCPAGSSAAIDFDGDGNPGGGSDVCYNLGIFVNNNAAPNALEPGGEVIVQGGEINLTGFSVAVGLRIQF